MASVTDTARATAAARRYCGWHVTPVSADEEITLDGPGGRLLVLPTLQLTELSAVAENGVDLDLGDLSWSAGGLVAKRDGSYWTDQLGAITVTFSHGYASAPDFDHAVAVIADTIAAGRGDAGLIRKRIDDVEYQWAAAGDALAGTGALLDKFRLEPRA